MLSIATASAQLTIPKEYLPEVHGTIRGKYELQTTNGMQRFQVRNARVSLDGKVLPVIAYKAEIDLSDEGSIKMLDAYARFVPNDTWNVTLGQMRVPFTIDAHRSPHQQYFANRSFIFTADRSMYFRQIFFRNSQLCGSSCNTQHCKSRRYKCISHFY